MGPGGVDCHLLFNVQQKAFDLAYFLCGLHRDRLDDLSNSIHLGPATERPRLSFTNAFYNRRAFIRYLLLDRKHKVVQGIKRTYFLAGIFNMV